MLGAGAYHSTVQIDNIEYSYSSVAVEDKEHPEVSGVTGVFAQPSEQLVHFNKHSHVLGHIPRSDK